MDVDFVGVPSSIYFPPMSQAVSRKRKRSTGGVKKTKRRKTSGRSGIAMRTGGWANPWRGREVKFVDVTPAPTVNLGSVQWSTPGILLNGMAPGSTASDRVGRKIVMTTLLIRWRAQMVITGIQGANFRILVVYDKQANAALPVITDILDSNDVLARQNLSNRDRFIVLVDKHSKNVGAQSDWSTIGKIYRKKLNLETIFNAGAAGTIGDIASGSVVLFIAHTGTTGTVAPTMNLLTRIRYTDV